MSKKPTTASTGPVIIKLEIEAGKANPSPPVGPALGQRGVNIMDFCKQFNEHTKDMAGAPIPVKIYVNPKDKSFTFVTTLPPVTYYIKKELNLKKASQKPGKDIIAKITQDQIKKIAEIKQKDLNVNTIEAAMNCVAGTATSMGIEVV